MNSQMSPRDAMNDMLQAQLAQRPTVRAFSVKVDKTHGVAFHNGKLRFFRKSGDPALAIKGVCSGNITIVNGVARLTAGGTGIIEFGGAKSALGRDMVLERIRIALKGTGGGPYGPNSSPQPLVLVSAAMKNGAPQLFPQDNDGPSGIGSASIERFLVGPNAGYGAPSDGSEDDEPLGYINATNAYQLTIFNYDSVNPVDFTVDGSVV